MKAYVIALLLIASPSAALSQTASPTLRQGEVLVVPPATEAPTWPEDRVPEAERMALLEAFVTGDAPRRERRWALGRAQERARKSGDPALVSAWAQRERDFIDRETALVQQRVLPEPARACDSKGANVEAGLPLCSPRRIDYDIGDDYTLLADLAHKQSDFPREIALRERAAIFLGGSDPHPTYWTELGALAAELGQDDVARRVCNYLRASQYRADGAEPFPGARRCDAYAAYKAHRWTDWLALERNGFDGVAPDRTEALARYCVAFTHAGENQMARRACGAAENSVRARTEHFKQAAAFSARSPAHERALAMTIDHGDASGGRTGVNTLLDDKTAYEATAGHEVSSAEAVLAFWSQDKRKLEDALAACRAHIAQRALLTGCDTPAGVRGLNVRFRSVSRALQGIVPPR